MRRRLALVLAAIVALSVAGAAQAAPAKTKRLNGSVGPGFTIKVAKKTVKAGRYTFVIRDRSSAHNWHITGPGVNRRTSVPGTGTKRITVRLRKGTYTIVCDPHSSTMRTTLRVT